jgi:LPXTG-motif cell wall-anchored protein
VLESSGSSSTSVSSSAQMEVATTSSTSTDTGPSALPLITLAGVVALAAASGTVLLRRTNNTPD